MHGRTRQHGFSTLELLVALAVAALATTLVALALRQAGDAARHTGDAAAADAFAADLAARLRADADAAVALGVPIRDLHGAPNGDGHELDLLSRDAAGHTRKWAYAFAGGRLVEQRYDEGAATWGPPGTLGPLRSFAAVAVPASTLADPPLGGYRPGDVVVAAGDPALPAGNGVVRVRFAGAAQAHDVALTAGVRPSSFTVVLALPTGAPVGGGAPPPTPPGRVLFRDDASGVHPGACWLVAPGGVPHHVTVLTGTLSVEASRDGGVTWTRVCAVTYATGPDCLQTWTAVPDPCPNGMQSSPA